VAFVERPNRSPPDSAAAARLNEAFKLAEQLGGTSVVLTGDDLVVTVLDHARRNNITQIVVGKSRRSYWRALLGRALIPALSDQASGVALHVITTIEASSQTPPPRRSLPKPWLDASGFAGAAALVAAAAVLAQIADRFAEDANLAMVFMLSVLISGLASGLWPALFAAALAAVVYNFFFLEPRLTMLIGQPSDVLTFAVFFAGALATGWLTGRVRDQAKATSRRASAVTALLASSRRLSSAAQRGEAAKTLAEQLAASTGAKTVVLLPSSGDIAVETGSPALEALSTADMAAARWAWERGEPAGAGQGTLPNIAWTFWPLQGVKARVGVVGVEARADRAEEDERFLLAMLDQGAVALERADFAADAADAEALRRTDRLRTALLNSVSHDLRTPLSTVLGASTTLIDYRQSLSDEVQADLLLSIREEAERLNRYVGNLLDMSRLEGGVLTTRREWTDVREVLTAAEVRVERRLGARRLERAFPEELTLVKTDAALLEQALVNILENAIAYSPDGSAIELAAYEDRSNVVISIEDEGRGIPTAELERVFERFRRMEEATDRGKGAGLGLAIAKGFVEAMGGRIAAASPIHEGLGTRILISLRKDVATPEAMW
jgi:two-component system sensor histidine kinase KdpD